MSNFLIFKAAFNNSATPAIGTYTAEGGTALFNRNTSLSPDYYLYNIAQNSAVQWFVPTAETTDFEFVADILTRNWSNQVTYFIIADSTGTTRLRMWSEYTNWYFENSDSISTTGSPEYIGVINPTTSGGLGVFHQFRVRVRKLTASSSSVEVYVDGMLKLTATAGAALVTCAKIGFVGGVGTFGPGMDAGIKNAYVYDLSGGDVIDRGVLSGAFNRFISWAKNIFATKDNVVLRSGGNIMTGTNLGRPDNNGTLSISGGTTVGGNTGYIRCYGAAASTYGGAVEIGGKNIKFIFRNSAIESWAGSQDLGSSDRRFNTAYIKALNINGTAAGDILTHNASEFVNVTSAQTIAGDKDFTGTTGTHDVIPATTDTYNLGSSTKEYNNAYIKSLTINGVACGDILTHNADEFVPRSGGAVMTGTSIARTVDNDWIALCGGSTFTTGCTIQCMGMNHSGAAGRIYLRPAKTNEQNDMFIYSSGTWTWTGTACQITSDQRLKQQISEIDDKLLDAWQDVELSQFKYNDAVDAKGDKARLHTGYVVQQIDKSCKSHNVDISQYGLFCHEEYPQETEEVEVTQKDGTKTKETRVIREASEHYSLRYTEVYAVECMYLRRCIERLTARIEQLEKGIERLTARIEQLEKGKEQEASK